MSNIVAVIASPRKSGNGAVIVDKMAEAAKAAGNDVQVFSINSMDIKGCQACMGCKKAGQGCIRKDDLTPVLNAIKECDAVIFAVPDYFGQPCGQYRCLEDRMYGYLGADFSCCLKPGMKFVPVVNSMSGAGSENVMAGIKAVMGNYFKMECAGEIDYCEGKRGCPAKDNADLQAEIDAIVAKL